MQGRILDAGLLTVWLATFLIIAMVHPGLATAIVAWVGPRHAECLKLAGCLRPNGNGQPNLTTGKGPCPSSPCRGRFRPTALEHPSSTQPSTIDMKMALVWRKSPGQSPDHGCAARDSNPEPAD
jgi:hypothetical protein